MSIDIEGPLLLSLNANSLRVLVHTPVGALSLTFTLKKKAVTAATLTKKSMGHWTVTYETTITPTRDGEGLTLFIADIIPVVLWELKDRYNDPEKENRVTTRLTRKSFIVETDTSKRKSKATHNLDAREKACVNSLGEEGFLAMRKRLAFELSIAYDSYLRRNEAVTIGREAVYTPKGTK